MNEPITRKRLEWHAEEGERAIYCPVCRGAIFEVMLDPSAVAAERELLRAFYRVRLPQSACDAKDVVEFTQGEPTFVVRCYGCGTLLRNPQPRPDALRERYESDTYGRRTLGQLLQCELPFFREKAAWLGPRMPESARVLEVGSFVGAFLLVARERGWRAVGIDIGQETVEFTRSLGLDVILGDLRDAALPAEFDAVCIWNTLDQTDDPRAVLERSRKVLRPGGLLVVRLPNGRYEEATLEGDRRGGIGERRLIGRALNNFLTFPYLNGFTPESFAQLAEEVGFRIEEVRGDTLVPLAGPHWTDTLVAEESEIKERMRRLFDRTERLTGRVAHPWFDVLARSPK